MTGAFAAAAFSTAFYVGGVVPPVVVQPLGGANPWYERSQLVREREITEERIRKAKESEVEAIIAELREQGILPQPLVEAIDRDADYRELRRLYAAQLAQIAERVRLELLRQQEDDELLIVLMMGD